MHSAVNEIDNAAGIGLGVLVGKQLKMPRNAMYLISVGTSICGGSAIAATTPVLKAKAHDIAIASATIFALNAIALLIFLPIGKMLGFTETQFGYWAALAIHGKKRFSSSPRPPYLFFKKAEYLLRDDLESPSFLQHFYFYCSCPRSITPCK